MVVFHIGLALIVFSFMLFVKISVEDKGNKEFTASYILLALGFSSVLYTYFYATPVTKYLQQKFT